MANWGNILSRGNVEDRRSMAPVAAGGLSITGLALYLIFNLLTGGEADIPLDQLQNIQVQEQQGVMGEQFKGEDSYEVFASTVLGSNNDMWSQTFAKANREYDPPKLVLFRTATNSSCGVATSEVGPHYCPNDQTIYLDETFFDALKSRFGAEGGDVAEAYVISHEVGHHVQNILGTFDKVGNSRDQENSIKLELQADCYAGLWANSIKNANVFEQNEIHEAMDAAEAVGDDRIQKKVEGYVDPESWTHGSSEQRKDWFNRGYEQGTLSSCDTFR
jgi:uncharacterized protein